MKTLKRLKWSPLLVLTVLQQSISDLEVYKTKTDRTVITQPEFVATDQYQVENVTEGHSISLKCRVINLASHHTVSWIRLSDVQVLTVGGLVFSSDPRIEVSIQTGRRPGSGTWTLRISPVVVQDSGTYQCQINTEPSSTFDVSVIVNPLHRATDEESNLAPEEASQYNALLTDSAQGRNPAAIYDIFAAVESQSHPPIKEHSTWGTQASPSYLPHVNQHVYYPQEDLSPPENEPEVTSVYKVPINEVTSTSAGGQFPGQQSEEEQSVTDQGDAKDNQGLDLQPIVADPGPHSSSLEEAISTKLSEIQTDLQDTKDDNTDEENVLMIPILSLFSVSAFIVILGVIRSFCFKSKTKDEDLYSRGSAHSQRSRTGTGESQRSRASRASRGSRGSRVSRNTVRSREEPVYQVQDTDSKHSDRSSLKEKQIYYEIRTPEPPLLEVIQPTPDLDKQRSQSGEPVGRLLQDGVHLGGGVDEVHPGRGGSRPRSKDKFAGINKAGVRRSRERYFASEETLYSASSIPDDESLPSLSQSKDPEHQYQVPGVQTKRKVYFNPFEDFSE